MANEIYNTTWWGNAIDTAITAGTEPDFFGSQMKMLTSQQPELVVNGDFATDSDWIKGTGWTISGGVASCDGTQTGITSLKAPSSNSGRIGNIYKCTFTVSNYSAGQIRIAPWGNVVGAWRSGNGTYTEYIYISIGNFSYIFMQGDASFIGSIDNVSIKLARAEEVEAVKCLADWIHTTALQDLNN